MNRQGWDLGAYDPEGLGSLPLIRGHELRYISIYVVCTHVSSTITDSVYNPPGHIM